MPLPYVFALLYMIIRCFGFNQIYSILLVCSLIFGYESLKVILKNYMESHMRIIRENHGMWEFCDD